ncbi:redoxin domain-containing protein [bacterium]|nr:redoxin domain-containing protein [bacterium]
MRKLTMILGSALLMATLFAACTIPAPMPSDTEVMAEDTMADDKMADDTMAEDKMADDKMADDTMADDKMADDKMADDKMADDTMADDKMADDKMADDKMADDTMADDTMADDKMADDKMADDKMADDKMADDKMADDKMADDKMEAMDLPAWQTLPLIDVRTGETFTLADYAGKALLIEPMATWCPNCRTQLGNVKTAVASANPDQMAFLALSVEAGLDASALAAYADQNEFNWRFAVTTPEMLQALAETFGPTVANPPATPHFIVRPDGSYTELTTGFTSSEAILANLATAVAGQ